MIAGRGVKAIAAVVLLLALASCMMPRTLERDPVGPGDESKAPAPKGILSGTLRTGSFVVEAGEQPAFADGFDVLLTGDVAHRGSRVGVSGPGPSGGRHGASGRIVSDTRIVILGELRAGHGMAGTAAHLDGGDGGSLELVAPRIVCASGRVVGAMGGDGAPGYPGGGNGGSGGNITVMADRFEDLDGSPAVVFGGDGGAGGDGTSDPDGFSGNGGNGGGGGIGSMISTSTTSSEYCRSSSSNRCL